MNQKDKLKKLLSLIINYVEYAIAAVLALGIFYLIIQMVLEYGGMALRNETILFTGFLDKAMTLVIGIEFTKMLCHHTPDTVIDVLMFATARQAILDHSRIMENLLAVIAIAILFAVKKYVLYDGAANAFDGRTRASWRKGSIPETKVEPAEETQTVQNQQEDILTV